MAVLGWSSIVPGYAADTADAAAIIQDLPAKDSAVPGKDPVEPAKGNEPPTKVDEPPAKGNEPPAKGNEPPAKGNEPPAKVDEPSAKGSDNSANPHDGLVLYEGRWLKPAEATRREEARYRKQRVAAPFEVVVNLNAESLHKLQARRDLMQSLMSILRVGDRLVVKHEDQQWRLWKRHGKATGEFRQALAAFSKGKVIDENWGSDSITSINPEQATGEDALADMAFALHRRRNAYPLADMQADQLPNPGYTIKRNTQDGELTLLTLGGKGFKAEAGKPEQSGQLTLIRLEPGNDAVPLTWTEPPKRLLVVSDKQIPLLALPAEVSLLKNEKKSIRLSESKAISSVHRYSQGPDYKGWSQQDFTLDGPLAFQMDLSRDEAGPHGTAGDYKRVWILEFAGTEGHSTTQRQTAMVYRVKGDDKGVMSNEFLRR
jgi:hypothetical protein